MITPNNKSQAAIIELIFIAVLIASVSGYLISIETGTQKVSNIKSSKSNFGIQNLLLNENSSIYIQDLVQNEVPLNNSAWNESFNTLNSINQGNLVLLDSNLTILDSKESCSISAFNSKVFTLPILLYNSTTQEINELRLLEFEACRIEQ